MSLSPLNLKIFDCGMNTQMVFISAHFARLQLAASLIFVKFSLQSYCCHPG
jgi:hypothetical protein